MAASADPGPSAPAYRYRAFVSYSQKDREFSDWLHRALETYRVPRRLVGRATREGPVPPRLYPVFRDREELPTNADLGGNLVAALEASRYLVVVCSPRAAKSRWVNEEVRAFKAMGREDRVLAVIAGGEPNASDRPDGEALECFPPALRHRVGADGRLTDARCEPIAADARPGKDSRRAVLLKVVAGLIGVGFAELSNRDVRRRRVRGLLAAALGLLVVALVGATWLAGERSKARAVDRQLAVAREGRAKRFLEAHDEVSAALYFAEANRLAPSRATREAALFHIRSIALPRGSAELGEPAVCADVSSDGSKFLVMGETGLVRVFDLVTFARVCEFRVGAETYMFRRASFTRDGRRVFAAAEYARIYDATTGVPLAPAVPFPSIVHEGAGVRESEAVVAAALDPTERYVVLAYGEGSPPRYFDAASSKEVPAPPGGDRDGSNLAFLHDADDVPRFSPDRRYALMPDDAGSISVDLVAPAQRIESLRHDGHVLCAAFHPASSFVVTGGFDRLARRWRITREVRSIGEPIRHPGAVSRVRFSRDGALVVSVSGDVAFLWDFAGEPEMVMPHSDAVVAAVFAPDGRTLVTASKDGRAYVWSADDRRTLPRVVPVPDEPVDRALGPDGERMLVLRPAGSRFGTPGVTELQVYDRRAGRALGPPVPFEARLRATAFRADGAVVAIVQSERIARDEPVPFGADVPERWTVRLLDATTGAWIGEPFELPSGRSGGDSETPDVILRFAPSGKSLLVVRNRADRIEGPDGGLLLRADAWTLDARTGRPLGTPVAMPAAVGDALVRRSGDALLAISGAVRVLRAGAAAVEPEPVVSFPRVLALALSPDEETLLTASREEGRLWRLASREPIGAPLAKPGYTEVHGAAFGPDGRLVATLDGSVLRVFDARTAEPVGPSFKLGRARRFGEAPRFSDATHVLAPGSAGLEELDLGFLLGDVEPDALVAVTRLLTRREVGADGEPRVLDAATWETLWRAPPAPR